MSRLALGALALLAACSASSARLSVDLRTDWVAGEEFVGARAELLRDAADTTGVRAPEEMLALAGTSYAEGVRIAEWSTLGDGDYTLRVTLVGRDGMPRARRMVRVTVHGETLVTVPVTRSCLDVVCPAPAGDPSLTECLGARCVDPRCTPEHPEHCPPPVCAGDAECTPADPCADGACRDGACLSIAHDERCGAGLWCSPSAGCLPRAPSPDAGTSEDAAILPPDTGPPDAFVPSDGGHDASVDGGCGVRPDPRGDGSIRFSGGTYCPGASAVSTSYLCVDGSGRIEIGAGETMSLELYGPEATVVGGAGIVPTGPGATLVVTTTSTAPVYLALDLSAFPLTVQPNDALGSLTLIAHGTSTLTLASITVNTLYVSHEGALATTGNLFTSAYTPDGVAIPPPACAP